MLLFILGWLLCGVISVYLVGVLDRMYDMRKETGFIIFVATTGFISATFLSLALVVLFISRSSVISWVYTKAYTLGRGK